MEKLSFLCVFLFSFLAINADNQARSIDLGDAIDIFGGAVIDTLGVNAEYNKAVNFYNEGAYKQALPIFRKLAKDGHVESQYIVGMMYQKGEGTKVNFNQAERYYNKAAQKGHENAIAALAGLEQAKLEHKRAKEKAKVERQRIAEEAREKARDEKADARREANIDKLAEYMFTEHLANIPQN